MDYEKLTKEEYWSIVRGKMNDLFELMQAKNDDYAEGADFFANFRQAEEFGVDALKGLFVRMGDKMSRIKSWSRRGDLKVGVFWRVDAVTSIRARIGDAIELHCSAPELVNRATRVIMIASAGPVAFCVVRSRSVLAIFVATLAG